MALSGKTTLLARNGMKPWSTGWEPTIHELLPEPIVQALMKADRANPEQVEAMLCRARRRTLRERRERTARNKPG
jgi:hypothetical protein